MQRRFLIPALAVGGVLLAGGLGYAAYLASRDSVGLPVTRLEPQPQQKLAPTRRQQPRARPKPQVTARPTTSVDDHGGQSGTTTGDDRSGRGRGGSGSGSGSGSDSGSGSGGNSGPGGGGDD